MAWVLTLPAAILLSASLFLIGGLLTAPPTPKPAAVGTSPQIATIEAIEAKK